MQSRLTKFFVLLFLLPFSTCTPLGSNSGFDVILSQTSVLFINASAATCSSINAAAPDSGVAGVYFQLNNMVVNWTNSQHPLTIQWVEFKSTDPNINAGSPLNCQIGGSDLMNAWVQQWAVTGIDGQSVCSLLTPPGQANPPQSVVITASTPSSPACNIVALTNSCPFKCGGITMTNKAQTSSGGMTLEIYATYDSGGGNLIPLVLYKSLTYFYQGN